LIYVKPKRQHLPGEAAPQRQELRIRIAFQCSRSVDVGWASGWDWWRQDEPNHWPRSKPGRWTARL